MTIVAFLQNPWFRAGTDPLLIKKYRTDADFRRRVLGMSATGRALYEAFGGYLYYKIIWDNANPEHGDHRSAKMPADIVYMAAVLCCYKPDLILCFGNEAQKGMKRLMDGQWPNVLFAPHPMARGSSANHLKDIVKKVKAICEQGKSSA